MRYGRLIDTEHTPCCRPLSAPRSTALAAVCIARLESSGVALETLLASHGADGVERAPASAQQPSGCAVLVRNKA